MTDRKRIYAIHIVEPQPSPSPGALYRDDIRDVHIYRKTRFQQTTHRRYRTERGLALAFAMRQAGYPARPFTQADWAVGELPYRLVYRETGVKFEIPGRFESLRAFDALSPLHV